MNQVAMPIISPRKEFWPSQGSNQRLPDLKSGTLPTEVWGSSDSIDRGSPVETGKIVRGVSKSTTEIAEIKRL